MPYLNNIAKRMCEMQISPNTRKSSNIPIYVSFPYLTFSIKPFSYIYSTRFYVYVYFLTVYPIVTLGALILQHSIKHSTIRVV